MKNDNEDHESKSSKDYIFNNWLNEKTYLMWIQTSFGKRMVIRPVVHAYEDVKIKWES